MTQQCRLHLDWPKDENTSCLSRKLALHWDSAVFSFGCSAVPFPPTWQCWLISCHQNIQYKWVVLLLSLDDGRWYGIQLKLEAGIITVVVLATEHVTVWGLLDLSSWNVLLDSCIGRLMHCWLCVCVCVREVEQQVLLSLSTGCTRCSAEGDGDCYEWRLINEIIR